VSGIGGVGEGTTVAVAVGSAVRVGSEVAPCVLVAKPCDDVPSVVEVGVFGWVVLSIQAMYPGVKAMMHKTRNPMMM